MKILVGTDIVEIGRFSKHVKFEENGKLPHFITRCYTPKEIEYCMGKKLDKARLESLAARFAAKEAVSDDMGAAMLNYMPLRGVLSFAAGKVFAHIKSAFSQTKD